MSKQFIATAVTATTLALTGCGGGGGGSSSTGGGGSLNGAGGIWTGTVSDGGFAGYKIFGIFADNGHSKFWIHAPLTQEGHAGVDFVLSSIVNPTGAHIGSAYTAYGNGVKLPNGTYTETGLLEADVDTTTGKIAGTFQSSDSGSNQDTATFSMKFDSTYSSGSDPATLTANGGAYSFTMRKSGLLGSTITGSLQLIDAGNGLSDNVVGSDNNGCNYTGSVTVIDPQYDAYDISLSVASICAAPTGGVNMCASPQVPDAAGCTYAGTLTGVGAFFPKTSTLKMIVDDGKSAGYEIVAQ
jgi:hypothetical protein